MDEIRGSNISTESARKWARKSRWQVFSIDLRALKIFRLFGWNLKSTQSQRCFTFNIVIALRDIMKQDSRVPLGIFRHCVTFEFFISPNGPPFGFLMSSLEKALTFFWSFSKSPCVFIEGFTLFALNLKREPNWDVPVLLEPKFVSQYLHRWQTDIRCTCFTDKTSKRAYLQTIKNPHQKTQAAQAPF